MLCPAPLRLAVLLGLAGIIAAHAVPSTPEDTLRQFNVSGMAPAYRKLTATDLNTLLDAVFLQPAPVSEEITNQVPDLLVALGDDAYHAREQTSATLKSLGPGILPLLKSALPHPDPEIRFRLKDAIAHLQSIDIDYAALDYPRIAKRISGVLQHGLADDQHAPLARGIAERMNRGSIHEGHHILVAPLIATIIASGDNEVINLLRPVLDATDRKLATSVVRGLNPPQELDRLPALLIEALHHPNPHIPAHLLLNRVHPPDDDPRRLPLRDELRRLLSGERQLPIASRLNAAATLFYDYQDPLAARAFASMTGEDEAPLIAKALSDPLLVGIILPEDFVRALVPLRDSPHDKVRDAAVIFLLQRTRATSVQLGIESLNRLEEPDIDGIARALSELVSNDLLQDELRAAASNPNNASRLLNHLPTQAFDPASIDPFSAFRLR